MSSRRSEGTGRGPSAGAWTHGGITIGLPQVCLKNISYYSWAVACQGTGVNYFSITFTIVITIFIINICSHAHLLLMYEGSLAHL